MTVVNATDARSRFAALLKEAESDVVQITQRNRPAAALISWEVYESLLETLEILSEPELLLAIKRSEQQIGEGKVVRWADVRNRYLG